MAPPPLSLTSPDTRRASDPAPAGRLTVTQVPTSATPAVPAPVRERSPAQQPAEPRADLQTVTVGAAQTGPAQPGPAASGLTPAAQQRSAATLPPRAEPQQATPVGTTVVCTGLCCS